MKALVWMGKKNVEVQTVDDPAILNPRDCIVKTMFVEKRDGGVKVVLDSAA